MCSYYCSVLSPWQAGGSKGIKEARALRRQAPGFGIGDLHPGSICCFVVLLIVVFLVVFHFFFPSFFSSLLTEHRGVSRDHDDLCNKYSPDPPPPTTLPPPPISTKAGTSPLLTKNMKNIFHFSHRHLKYSSQFHGIRFFWWAVRVSFLHSWLWKQNGGQCDWAYGRSK